MDLNGLQCLLREIFAPVCGITELYLDVTSTEEELIIPLICGILRVRRDVTSLGELIPIDLMNRVKGVVTSWGAYSH